MAPTQSHCPICDGPSSPTFFAAQYSFFRCQSCRTAFVSPQPTPEELSAFYDAFHRSNDEGGVYDEFEERMQADFPAKVQMILRYSAKQPLRLLDVGCGKGYFVRACIDAGIDAEGIDLSASGVRFAREELSVNCHVGDLREAKETLGKFDVATFWATIEHLSDPIGMLRCIADVLTPEGRLYLDTGIGDDWLDRLLPGRVQWYDPPQHLFVFSAKGLRLALERAGFRLVDFDPSFERTPARRILKTLRNGAVAAAMRAATEVGFSGKKGPTFVRFPMGNLMSASAVKSGA